MLFAVHDPRASRVNLLMNDFAAGLPSPLAFLGLGAAIAPELGAGRWEVGVLPVLHELRVSQGRTKPEMTLKDKAFRPIEIAEDLIGSVRVSLLLDVPGCSDEFAVAKALLGRRIAGGAMANDTIRTERVTADGSAFRGMARGYAVIRAEGRMASHVATGVIEDLQAVAAALYPAEPAPGSGWHVPVAVGHRLLEDPRTVPARANTRDPDIPHVFAEPAVGIAELVSVRNPRLTGCDEAGLRDLLWRWTAEGRWVTGHPAYHPDHRDTRQESAHGQAETD